MNAEALAARTIDCGAQLIVTVDGFWRGDQLIKAKQIVDDAINICNQKVISLMLNLKYAPSLPTTNFVTKKTAKNTYVFL